MTHGSRVAAPRWRPSTSTSPRWRNPTPSQAMDTFYQRAYSLISSPKAREAFNIDAEPAAIRDEYGRNEAGQRLLMARRLVAAGVRVVSVTYGGWDFHTQIVPGTRAQMPPFDQAFAALIRDLDRTGLLNDTIVMVSSEFGRTPKINKDAGRDHWPKVFSVVLAGGGFKAGASSARPTPRRPSRNKSRSSRPTCSPRSTSSWESTPPSGSWRRAIGRSTSCAVARSAPGSWLNWTLVRRETTCRRGPAEVHHERNGCGGGFFCTMLAAAWLTRWATAADPQLGRITPYGGQRGSGSRDSAHGRSPGRCPGNPPLRAGHCAWSSWNRKRTGA